MLARRTAPFRRSANVQQTDLQVTLHATSCLEGIEKIENAVSRVEEDSVVRAYPDRSSRNYGIKVAGSPWTI
jgi:hypothetical protein